MSIINILLFISVVLDDPNFREFQNLEFGGGFPLFSFLGRVPTLDARFLITERRPGLVWTTCFLYIESGNPIPASMCR